MLQRLPYRAVPGADDSQLLAISRPVPEAAVAFRRAWDTGRAVALLAPASRDPLAPLERLAPTHVLDADGERAHPGGRGVASPVGAVIATSGTTGAPRWVELDRRALVASATAVSAALGLDAARDRWLVCLPLHHVAGLAILVRSAVTGVPVTLQPGFDVQAVAAAAGEATVVSLVPTTLRRLLAAAPDAVGRFRYVLLGGGPVDDALVTAARATGTTVVTTYGLTETGGGCVHDGHPLPGVEITLAPGTNEVLVRGPVVMRGYRDADAPDLWRAGWLATGDVGRWRRDGRLAIVDRLKDLVITGGVNVSPVAVERALADAPGVTDLAVAGEPDPEWGERVVAYVVPAPVGAPTLDALRGHGRARGLTEPELPRAVRVMAAIPRTAAGKIRRATLAAVHASGS